MDWLPAVNCSFNYFFSRTNLKKFLFYFSYSFKEQFEEAEEIYEVRVKDCLESPDLNVNIFEALLFSRK